MVSLGTENSPEIVEHLVVPLGTEVTAATFLNTPRQFTSVTHTASFPQSTVREEDVTDRCLSGGVTSGNTMILTLTVDMKGITLQCCRTSLIFFKLVYKYTYVF